MEVQAKAQEVKTQGLVKVHDLLILKKKLKSKYKIKQVVLFDDEQQANQKEVILTEELKTEN